MPAPVEIVPLSGGDVDRLARAMARAFWRDPQMAWLMPDEADRARLLPWIMGASIRYALRAGQALTTPELAGLAIWLPPDVRPPGFLASARSGALAAPLKLGWSRFVRFTTMVAHDDQLRRRLAPAPHWHLAGLGVDPPKQRRGIASALLRPTLARADGQGIACYLETYNPANVPFYERHGFSVRASEPSIPDGPLMWAMKREPTKTQFPQGALG